MSVQIFKDAAKIALPLLVAAFALPAFGAEVDFTTTGVFACNGAVGCTTTANGSEIVIINHGNELIIQSSGFTNMNVPVNTSPQDTVNAIQFQTIASNHSTPSGAVDTTGATFTLKFNQTNPNIAPTKGTLGGTFSGTIDATASSARINFAANQTALVLGGNNEYSLDFLNPGQNFWTIPNPGIGHYSPTTETVTVTNVTPEPTFMALTGLGFAGLALVAYRRKRAIV
jgi:hypothetical protein